jgi:hypothetical protein
VRSLGGGLGVCLRDGGNASAWGKKNTERRRLSVRFKISFPAEFRTLSRLLSVFFFPQADAFPPSRKQKRGGRETHGSLLGADLDVLDVVRALAHVLELLVQDVRSLTPAPLPVRIPLIVTFHVGANRSASLTSRARCTTLKFQSACPIDAPWHGAHRYAGQRRPRPSSPRS